MNCYLLDTPRLPSQPASNVGGLVIHWTVLNWLDHFGTKHFGKSHFRMDVSSQEHFGTCTIWRCKRSGRWTFQHGNILTSGLFGTRNFWHSSTGLCRNVHIALQGAKISMCRRNVPVLKIHCAENSPCQYFPMSKGSPVETSICQNIRSAERCMCRNVPVMTHQCRNGL